jgi:outer membrane protein assembly factor BamB
MLMLMLLASVVSPSFAQDNSAEEFRHWTTSDGVRSKGRLKLAEVDGTQVRLLREDNAKEFVLQLSKLSKADRQYLKKRSAAIRQAAEKKDADSPTEDSVSRSNEEKKNVKSSPAQGDAESSWPQWRGPTRDGKSNSKGLLKKWPQGGPKLLWNSDGLGEGYSTPAIVDNVIYILGTRGDREFLIALSAEGGTEIWHVDIGPKTGGGGFPGPKGTPTVDDGMVFALGGEGDLVCVSVKTGKTIWHKNLTNDFGGSAGTWRYAESPLVDNGKVICTPGGERNTIVALNRKTGKPIWASSLRSNQVGGGVNAGYASPIAANIDGQDQYVVFLQGGVVGVDANRGRFLWSYNRPANDTANCSTPVVQDDSVFAASAYGTGGGRADISKKGSRWSANEAYFVRKMENHHGGFVLHDGHIYGTNNQTLLCIDWESGQIKWQDRCVGKGSTVYADGHLYVRGEKGDIALVEATPEGYKEKGRFSQPNRSNKNAWAHPVIAGGKLYLHDQGRLLCYELK